MGHEFGTTWLYWDLGHSSVGLAVSGNGDEGGLLVDLYGPAVNETTLRIVLENKLAYGAIERIDVFGFVFVRGYLPYDPQGSPDPGSVRRITFHHSRIGDGAVPLLKQFLLLRCVDLRETRITGAGVRELQASLPNCQIVY